MLSARCSPRDALGLVLSRRPRDKFLSDEQQDSAEFFGHLISALGHETRLRLGAAALAARRVRAGDGDRDRDGDRDHASRHESRGAGGVVVQGGAGSGGDEAAAEPREVGEMGEAREPEEEEKPVAPADEHFTTKFVVSAG